MSANRERYSYWRRVGDGERWSVRTHEHVDTFLAEDRGVFVLFVTQELVLVLGGHRVGVDERGDAEVQARQRWREVLVTRKVADDSSEVGSGRDSADDEAFLGVRLQR